MRPMGDPAQRRCRDGAVAALRQQSGCHDENLSMRHDLATTLSKPASAHVEDGSITFAARPYGRGRLIPRDKWCLT